MGDNKTSPLTEEFLLKVETRLRAATPGPWESFVEGRDHTSGSTFIRTPAGDIELSGASEADHDFIAHARQDQETLLAEIRRRRDEERDVSAHAEIVDSKEYGVVWTSKDADLADRSKTS